jgi:hypothetical protein
MLRMQVCIYMQAFSCSVDFKTYGLGNMSYILTLDKLEFYVASTVMYSNITVDICQFNYCQSKFFYSWQALRKQY